MSSEKERVSMMHRAERAVSGRSHRNPRASESSSSSKSDQNSQSSVNCADEGLIANRYKVVKRISRNANGLIRLVRDTKNNEELKCIKTIEFKTENRNEIKEIVREEGMLSSLSSPYVLHVHDSFFLESTLYIVTDYCEGGDLAHKIKDLRKRHIKLPEDQILLWLSQLIAAVYYIHSQGILHRNIKPANILIKNGVVQLGNFGIARSLKSDKEASTFIGTPYYMSPELVKNERYNQKSDIWSIGCVLYEMCTFQRPFLGDTIYEIFNSVVNDECPSIINLYSKDLNNILKNILIKKMSDRPAAIDLLMEPVIYKYVQSLVQKCADSASQASHVASLINSLSFVNNILDDEVRFDDYDDRSTLRMPSSSQNPSLRSSLNSDD